MEFPRSNRPPFGRNHFSPAGGDRHLNRRCHPGKDLNGILTDWNFGAERVFGFAADEMIGASPLLLRPKTQRFPF